MTQTTDKIQIHSSQVQSYTPRTVTYQQAEHTVVPVVMMVEGVHSGSLGPLYHSAEQLARSAAKWENQPVVINHPVDEENNYISANTEGVLSVGIVRNAKMDGSKLRAELYIHTQRMTAISPETMERIKQGHQMEVSIGIFSDEIEQEGEWNGEQYRAIAVNHIPDHLAILPHDVGACSYQDGCGIRVNSSNNKTEKPMENLTKVFKDLQKAGYAAQLIVNQTGFQELLMKVHQKLDSMDNEMRSYYMEELFEDYVVYRVRSRENNQSRLYKQNYSTTENGDVELLDNPVEVRRQVDYVSLAANKGKDATNKPIINKEKQGGIEMSETPKSPCLTGKVDALINNQRTKFTEEDRPWLLTQSEDTLNKLEPAVQEEKPVQANEKQVSREDALKVLNLNKLEDFTAIMPDSMKAEVESGVQIREKYRDGLVKSIQANSSEGTWTEDELKGFSCNQLAKINKSIGAPEVDYSGMGAGSDGEQEIQANTNQNDHGVEPLIPVGV